MPTLDRGYVPGHEALIHCITGAPWNPVDHLANLHDKLLIRTSGDIDPGRVWTFNVDHYRMADRVWADVDAALVPDEHGAVRVLVLHADVEPVTRRCQSCGTVIANGKPIESDWLAGWAKPRTLEDLARFGALPT